MSIRMNSIAVALALALSACTTTSGRPVVQRQLPPFPAYAQPVKVKDPKAGEDPLAVAARERAGRVKANRVIEDLNEWYQGVVSSYAAGR